MGLDFIRRAAPTFQKSWDRGRTALAQPTLFTRYPECRTRSVIAEFDDGIRPGPGTTVAVCLSQKELVLVAGITRMGIVRNAPPDLLNAIASSGGCALGHVVSINPLSGTADVEIE
jgi:hypothetical protein